MNCLDEISEERVGIGNPSKRLPTVLLFRTGLLASTKGKPHSREYSFVAPAAETVASVSTRFSPAPQASEIVKVISHLAAVLVRQHPPDFPRQILGDKPRL